jgi:hypothetical protein
MELLLGRGMAKMTQELLFPDDWKYRVVISCRDTFYACTEDEVWKILDKRGWGDTYWVYDKDGKFPYEFVPY